MSTIITDRIGRQEVLLPINHNYNKIWALSGGCHEMSGRRFKLGLFKISLPLALILANPDDVKTSSRFLFFSIYPLEKWHNYAQFHCLELNL